MSILGISHRQSYPPDILSTKTRMTCLLFLSHSKKCSLNLKNQAHWHNNNCKVFVCCSFVFRKDGFFHSLPELMFMKCSHIHAYLSSIAPRKRSFCPLSFCIAGNKGEQKRRSYSLPLKCHNSKQYINKCLLYPGKTDSSTDPSKLNGDYMPSEHGVGK